ncbi:UDP-glycosyltransferase 89B2-like [Rhodamnia argentea]|uniref:UDP-glycosyltransferase 89B2-like n=1 Tax=Rhodamnia argentea TaxID=178133 RepID=A0A8B8PN76_9MYRT|nr:UDP-glycosyltransferase 89B2-like [Rhodamnia argentea]
MRDALKSENGKTLIKIELKIRGIEGVRGSTDRPCTPKSLFHHSSSAFGSKSRSLASTKNAPAAADVPAGPPHLLVYPFLSSGHVIPLLDLADRLLRRGVRVTALVTPSNHHLLLPLLSDHPDLFHPLVIPAPDTPCLSKNFLIVKTLSMRHHHYPALLEWFRSHPSPPVAILSDFFLGWTRHLALELGVPRIVFSPSAAFAVSIEFSLYQNLPKNGGGDENSTVTFGDVPNSPTYAWWQISHLFRIYMEGEADMEFHREGWLANAASWGVVFNTFTELERVYVDHMKEKFGPDRVWAVGPLLPPVDDSVSLTSRGGSSSVPAEEVLKWLDGRKERSVVYVCFGSRTALENDQMAALATALEMSRVHFIWCVRETADGLVLGGHGLVPEGFESRTAGRGLVIRGWAPQVAILRHRAVGGFLTHCGWNSVLEGISAGVVMLTWPMGADQYTDATLLVDQLGVAIRACEAPDDAVPDPAELARALAESLDETRPERGRIKKLSEAAADAVNGGSSDKDLDGFVKSLAELQRVKK